MKIKLRKFLTLKHFIDYLRCLNMLKLQEKCQNGLESMFRIGWRHIRIMECIVANVLHPKWGLGDCT